jgi:hypothetical protein
MHIIVTVKSNLIFILLFIGIAPFLNKYFQEKFNFIEQRAGSISRPSTN